MTGGTAQPEHCAGGATIYDRAAHGYALLQAPQVLVLDTQRLLVSWRADPAGAHGDQGDILAAASDDGGATWSEARVVKRHDRDWSYVNSLLWREVDDVWLFYTKVSATKTDGEDSLLGAVCSTDNGHTWEEIPVSVSGVPGTGFPITGGAVLRMGSKHGDTYLLPFHTNRFDPRTPGRSAGVLRSTDLVSWSPGGVVPLPANGDFISEGMVAPAQDDSGALEMRLRASAYSYPSVALDESAYSSRSTDGGTTWSPARVDTDLPNYNSKAFFGAGADGSQLYVYNTTHDRARLNYKARRRGAPWSAPHALPDHAPGGGGSAFFDWTVADTYPMAAEHAPGRWYLVWVSAASYIQFVRLDLNASVYGPVVGHQTSWGASRAATRWVLEGGGGIADVTSDGNLHLRSANGQISRGRTSHWGNGSDGQLRNTPFTLSLRARLCASPGSPSPRYTGLGTSFTTGSRRLRLALHTDGVYALTGAARWRHWERVWDGTVDATFHTWTVCVDGSGSAALLVDEDTRPSARWTAPPSVNAPEIEHWVVGSAQTPAEAHIEWTRLMWGAP